VPDFVYVPDIVAKGSGSREVGDGLLVAGERGLIVQVKSRDRDAARSDDLAKAERWCRKHAAKAVRQGEGTRRLLSTGGVRAVSLRGYARVLGLAGKWPIVSIIDHPLDPPVAFDGPSDALYISLQDWLQLHGMVRSTLGLITYVDRALSSGVRVPLGGEWKRYRELAAADLRWASFSPTAVPVLPTEPLDPNDRFAADLFSELMDLVADSSSLGWDPEHYLRFIERLDRTPTLARVQIGRKMIETFQTMARTRSRRSFFTMDRESGAGLAVLYEYDHNPYADLDDRYFPARLMAYATLRYCHIVESGLDPAAGLLGVQVVHHPKQGRRYNFALIENDPPPLPPDLRDSLEEEFGIFDGTRIIASGTEPSQPGQSD
jgi:hypothetical protein